MELYNNVDECCGCGNCALTCRKNAITMQTDLEGFFYPVINKATCVECSKCIYVCPFKCKVSYNGRGSWSPLVYAAKHKSDPVRMSSSSGGVFTALSDSVLELNGVIYGVAFSRDFEVNHIRATTSEERDRCKGSKYVQSSSHLTYKCVRNDLLSDKWVLFTGTPCQNAGLNLYLHDVDKSKLILCDIICHGTASPQIWKDYLRFIEIKFKKKVNNYYFRYKEKSKKQTSQCAVFNDGMSISDNRTISVFNEIYFSHMALRPSCHNCKFASLNRPSDITIGDFWGIEKSIPDFNDGDGVSLVIVNSEKGWHFFNSILKDLTVMQSSIENCIQPNLQKPTNVSPLRKIFWDDYSKVSFYRILRKYKFYDGIFLKIKKILLMKFQCF